ncbi:MAG: hypothetical protein IJX02_03360 [Clostridia bacterium]|nr:hypothetical protein [Clostridia bacterium]
MKTEKEKLYKEAILRILKLLDEMEENQKLMSIAELDEEINKIYDKHFNRDTEKS